jgi:hypothetical protein
MAKGVKYQFKPIMLILLPEHRVSVAVAMNRNGTSTEWFDIAFEIPELFIIGRK